MGTIIFLVVIVIVFWVAGRKRDDVIEQKCSCGEREKCVSKIYITAPSAFSFGGHCVVERRPGEMLACGKIKKKMEEMKKIPIKKSKRTP